MVSRPLNRGVVRGGGTGGCGGLVHSEEAQLGDMVSTAVHVTVCATLLYCNRELSAQWSEYNWNMM
jgi:hypothetical protein